MKYITYIYMFGLFCSWGQTPAVGLDTIPNKYLIIKGDTITGQSIDLEEVVILPRLRLNTNEERRRYLILQRKTLKVYPYAKLAAERLETLNARMAGVKSKRQRKKYTRLVQKFVENEFADKLKKFTITEGQILIKLIHRQTGETAFDLIKELRSGWRAFWYNNTAKLFDMSLKIPFDPEVDEEDFLIEDILQRQFDKGNLEFQKSYKTFDLYTLNKIWKNKKGK
ncbi:MAG: DUF4294 domain-containing protein [Bacteroidetes bacterium]|nr:DUF4294 domain-containing protein [Bacteroidota bacterium]MDA1175835.1 DUF4294 domain-containing protein [Bacteroidota bacterium]MDA8531328.1 DUF4294 domain-containing protein [Flavobacteriaceae bacterium]